MTVLSPPAPTYRKQPTDKSAQLKIALVQAKLTAMLFVTYVINPPKVVFKKLFEIPLFVGGLACIDVAAFTLGRGWGWLAIGISLIVLEYSIADED